MIVQAMRSLHAKQEDGGSIEVVLDEMVLLHGKNKICEMASQPQVFTFEGCVNQEVKREIIKKL